MRPRRRIVSIAAGVLLAGLAVAPARAFVLSNLEWENAIHHYSWGPADLPVRFRLNNRPLTLLTNFAATSQIEPAVRAAMQVWQIPQTFEFRLDGTTTVADPGEDGVNVITLVDTPRTRDITQNIWAVTPTFFKVENGRVMIKETDIVFAPKERFATDGASTRGDFQGILTHELGHSVGLAHSPMATATMFGGGIVAGNSLGRTLSDDDIAGGRAIYRSGADLGNGTLTGTVYSDQGLPILGAHVVAIDESGVARVGALTNRFGGFTIPSLVPGNYQLYAEPLDGPMDPASVYSDEHKSARRDFRTTFAGGNTTPSVLAVAAGKQTPVPPIRVALQAPTLNVSYLLWSRDWQKWTDVMYAPVQQGQTVYLAVYGPRMDKLPSSNFRISGTEVTIARGNIGRGGAPDFNPPYVVLPLTAKSTALPGARTLFVDTGTELIAYSGAVDVLPR